MIVAVWVLTISEAAPVTVIVSEMLPTSSTTFTLAGDPSVSRTSVIVAVLNPSSDTVTAYEPGSSAGTEKTPPCVVTVVKVVAVALAFTTTVAPGMTPPPLSMTTPDSDVVAAPWA